MTDRALLLVLIVQAGMMLAGIGFLLQTRLIITPRSVWWSFMLRDLLWLALILDQIAGIYRSDLLPTEATILISFVITSLFLFSIVMRYKAHREKRLLTADQHRQVSRLEAMREGSELYSVGYSWDAIPQVKLRHWSKR